MTGQVKKTGKKIVAMLKKQKKDGILKVYI